MKERVKEIGNSSTGWPSATRVSPLPDLPAACVRQNLSHGQPVLTAGSTAESLA